MEDPKKDDVIISGPIVYIVLFLSIVAFGIILQRPANWRNVVFTLLLPLPR